MPSRGEAKIPRLIENTRRPPSCRAIRKNADTASGPFLLMGRPE